MQLVQMFKASLKPGRSILATLVMVGVVASVLSFAPTHGAANTLAETCANPPVTPTLNYWPVTYDDVNTPFCHDFPAIDAALDTTNPQFSDSESDWSNGLNMTDGQVGVALMYIHNGAANNLDPNQTTARDINITTQTDTSVGSSHRINVNFAGSNTNTVNKSFTINTPSNAKLEVIPNSGFMYDYQGHIIGDQQNLNLGNSTYHLGSLSACFEFSLFLSFKFKVVTTTSQNTSLSITKEVKNISNNTSYASSVNADREDRVGYRVTLRNNGPDTARNVTVTDNGVSGISIDSGSTEIEGNNNGFQNGDFPGTINLGNLASGEQVVITYTGRVKDECDTFTNRVTADASNTDSVSDTASVRVDNCNNDDNDHPKISIRKDVKNNTNGGSYTQSVNARNGDRVNFKVTVTNTGDTTLNNVRMTDNIPSGLQFDDSVSGDGTPSFNGSTFSVNFGTIREDDSKTVEFAARVTSNSSDTICNTAKATATSVSQVQDDACVNITRNNNNPGSPNIVLSKRAFNDTKNVDAMSTDAARGDYITYSLVTTNNGSADQTNYVIQDDLSQVLPLADMVSTNGGSVSGNMITYPSLTIRAGETVVKTFQVRVKQTLSTQLSYQLTNTYGNTIVIHVPGKVVYHAPTTGAAGTSAVAFAGLLTAAFVAVVKRNAIMKFIFA